MINLASDWKHMMLDHTATCSRSHPGPVGAEQAERFRQLLSRISYKKDWRFHVMLMDGYGIIQLQTIVPDSKTAKPFNNNGRLLHLCPDMDDGFVIDLAFELIKEFELHEVAEIFRLDGEDVYYPHESTGRPVFVVSGLCGSPLPSRPTEGSARVGRIASASPD